MIFAGILAGGKGTRVGTNVPKQFLVLNGKPVLIRTVDAFMDIKQCDFIYISVNGMWVEYTEKLIEDFYNEEERKRIRIVEGGKERIQSFLSIINDIKAKHGINADDIVLSHDAVRPFVTKEIILDCIEQTKLHRVAMATIQSADTTYTSTRAGFLTSTYDRKSLFLAQTPQGCTMDLMCDVIDSYSEDELLSMTGTSQLFVNRNVDVKISLGSPNNLKITTLKDVDFAEYLFKKTENGGI
ncbi:MAG: 2-C-methyl-D-erythritol 4-phosphate cytidylyltransferase [Prevotella sp.]|nr:2-C-methyl-D-erythritol 4-phosphate cytidylyltransferase [Prevotella sp.]